MLDEIAYLEAELSRTKAEIKKLNLAKKDLEQHILEQTLEILGVSDDPNFFNCSKEELAAKIAAFVKEGADLKIANVLIKEYQKKHKNK
jgi:uncharacterized small protein (DUF1192 family)